MLGNFEIVFIAKIANKLLKLRRLNWRGVLAADAIQMVVMRNEWFSEFVVIFPADSHGIDDLQPVKDDQRAVNASAVDVFALFCNIAGSQRNIGFLQCVENLLARFGEAQVVLFE